jgi:hypothetical protein
MIDHIFIKAKQQIKCPWLSVVDSGAGGYLDCLSGIFDKKNIISYCGGWALEKCFACKFGTPRIDPFGLEKYQKKIMEDNYD